MTKRFDHTFWGPLIAVVVPLLAVVASSIFLKTKLTPYFSDTKLTDQISYCWFRGDYTVKQGRHKGERWYKEGYLPCYFIPYRTEV